MTTDEQRQAIQDKEVEIEEAQETLDRLENELEDLWQTDLTEEE